MKIFLPVVFTTLCSFANAQESLTQSPDTSATLIHNSDSTSFVFRTDVLDILSTLIEKDNFRLTVGLEFVLTGKCSIRLQARTEHISERSSSTTEFRSGPEVIKYFGQNVNGSFYSAVYLEYIMYRLNKYDGNFTYINTEQFFSPGTSFGYCYSAAKHFIIEPSIRVGYGHIFTDSPLNVRIGLYTGYSF